ncbi:MAG: hypothetical protein PHP18_05665 [Bacilli bacterium]|nr:hypothetical protein [Bacilli bacterium]
MVDSDEGEFRIVRTDASETQREVLYACATELLDISTDPRQKQIIAQSMAGLMQDDKLKLELKVATATTVDYGLSTMQIPVRIKNMRTKSVYETFFRHGDFATADVTVPANKWTEIGSYTVKAQESLKIGHSIAENSRIYIALVENA